MLKKYEELNDAQKEVARKWHPDDYTQWVYKTACVDIEFCAR